MWGDVAGDCEPVPAQRSYPKTHVDEPEGSTTCSKDWPSSQQADLVPFKFKLKP